MLRVFETISIEDMNLFFIYCVSLPHILEAVN